MIRGPVQFLLDTQGNPRYAVLLIEDYQALVGEGEARHAIGPVAPDVHAEMVELPAEVAALIERGSHPIAAWREHRGLTREVLAGWIGFDEEDIAHFEDNDAVPTVEILQMIANALNVPAQALLRQAKG